MEMENMHPIVEFLSDMEPEDLNSLANTITGGKVTLYDKKDAIHSILLCSKDFESILKRKKVSRDYLFRYLLQHGQRVFLTDEKAKLIQLVLQFWVLTAPNRMENVSARKGDLTKQTPDSESKEIVKGKIQDSQKNADEEVVGNVLDSATVNILSHKYCEWFYNLINSDSEQFSLQNLWQDAVFNVIIKNGNQIVEQETAEGVISVIELFNKLKIAHRLYFRPNINPEGVCGKSEPHGAVFIVVCGTLHKSVSEMVGVFEQAFLILRDPLASDAWKIKKTELNLKCTNSDFRCTIQESKYASILGK